MTSLLPEQIVDRLSIALESARLPQRQRALGSQIRTHLSEAVRVVVLGRPGSGKTSVVNMMMGEEVLCPPAGAELVEVVFGPIAQTTLTWGDGAERVIEGSSLEGMSCEGATCIKYELPLDTLKSQNFCEITQPDDQARQQALLATALSEGQVFVWCSETFGPLERQMWKDVPDQVKDHSFLALTKADRQIMKGDLTDCIAELEAVVSDEFLGLHPIATLHALKARSEASLQRDLWEASGGCDLYEAVQTQVKQGRAADIDQAVLLLTQLGETLDVPASSAPARSGGEDLQTEVGQADLLEQLQIELQTAAQQMLADMDAGKLPNADGIVARCSTTLDSLMQMLSAEADAGGTATDVLDDMHDGAETLTLLQVEQGPKSAEDAVVLLLQLKKELSARTQA